MLRGIGVRGSGFVCKDEARCPAFRAPSLSRGGGFGMQLGRGRPRAGQKTGAMTHGCLTKHLPDRQLFAGGSCSMNHASSRERLDRALEKIADPKGEGARACLTVYRDAATAASDAADARARAGISLGPLDGAIVTIKD